MDAVTVSDPEVLSSSGLKEESSPPRKKLKKDTVHLEFNDQHLYPSKVLDKIEEEEPKSILAEIMYLRKMQQCKEEEVGITEFISLDLPGFTGILKKR